MKVVARLCSAAVGFASVFVFAALFQVGPSHNGTGGSLSPISVRPNNGRPISSLQAEDDPATLTEVRSRTLEAKTLLRRSGIVEAQLLQAINATREEASLRIHDATLVERAAGAGPFVSQGGEPHSGHHRGQSSACRCWALRAAAAGRREAVLGRVHAPWQLRRGHRRLLVPTHL